MSGVARLMRQVSADRCTAVDEAPAAALDAFEQRWAQRYPTIVNLRRSHWTEFVPF